ncbi:ABC transporter ATP-binding protein [Haloarchaeobius sp. TZWSO28]|uniref:ABC transporter ATP-binding protein n=1 Tax=Haloarchaeobius sp. TZWSO28 TaxID=3446119 RepID=UPI003EBE55A2
MTTMIDATNVRQTYGSVTALDGVSLSVDRGETFGLVGTNGAGKTTLFRLLVGHETPDEGEVQVAGLGADAGVERRRHVGFLPEDAGFEPRLTGREVLTYYARLRDVPADERDHQVQRVLATVGLADAADREVAGYSNGMTRRLGLGTTLLTRPDVLLLDEPTAGLDPEGVADFHDVVRSIAETDMTVVLTSHDLREVEALCDRATILRDGHEVATGPVEALRNAVATKTTVTCRLASDTDPAPAVEAVTNLDGVELTVQSPDDPLVVTCPQGDEGAVLDAIREAVDVAAFEVTGPEFADAFRQHVADDRPANEVFAENGGEAA